VVISSSLYAPNGTKLEDHPREAREMPSFLSDGQFYDSNKNFYSK
jgi:hypothetical protein